MRKDLLLAEDNDLAVDAGDFVTGESDAQHVELLLVLQKGELKENPTIGIGLSNYIGKQSTSISEMKREIKVGLEADGYKVTKLNIGTDGNFDLDYEPTE